MVAKEGVHTWCSSTAQTMENFPFFMLCCTATCPVWAGRYVWSYVSCLPICSGVTQDAACVDAGEEGECTCTDLVLDLVVFRHAASKQLAPQQVSVVFQEREVQVAEELNVLVLHLQLHRRIPVDDLKPRDSKNGVFLFASAFFFFFFCISGCFMLLCKVLGPIHTRCDTRSEANLDAELLVVTTVLFTLHTLSNAHNATSIRIGPGSISSGHASSRVASSVHEAKQRTRNTGLMLCDLFDEFSLCQWVRRDVP